MKFLLQRFSDNRRSTLGLFFYESVHEGKRKPVFFSYCLEDEFREVKVSGNTRIPAGTYKLGIRKQDTNLTLRYRKKYDWFKYHIEVLNVPNFSGIYIHIGNSEADTDGCLLLGDNADNNRLSDGMVSNSTQAFKRFYMTYYDEIEKGESTIEIRDEKTLL